MAQRLKALAVLVENLGSWVLFPVPTWQLTTIYNA